MRLASFSLSTMNVISSNLSSLLFLRCRYFTVKYPLKKFLVFYFIIPFQACLQREKKICIVYSKKYQYAFNTFSVNLTMQCQYNSHYVLVLISTSSRRGLKIHIKYHMIHIILVLILTPIQ